jgi:hypothetical protein
MFWARTEHMDSYETLASFMTHLWFLSLTTGGQELIGVSFVMLELQSKFVTYGRMLVWQIHMEVNEQQNK